MVIPTMIDARTTQSEEFVNDIQAAYAEIAGEPVAQSQNIGNLQSAGRTLFDAADDELYSTGKRSRDAYQTNTELLLEQLTPR